MIKTNHIISDINNIPNEWIYEHYLNLEEKLTGQDVCIKSCFNPKETRPSMYIYYNKDKGCYMHKDYSTDRSGNGIILVQQLLNLKSSSHAAQKVISDYSDYIKSGGKKIITREYNPINKYKVVDIESRNWNVLDKNYWSKYHITSYMLDEYNIQPIRYYKLCNTINTIEIKKEFMYGYFDKFNVLYKIYTPMHKTKFFKLLKHTQGLDQLTYSVPYLIICSSMKDLLSFKALRFKNAEAIAPDSENTTLDKNLITELKFKYKKVCTLFDNDEAGLRAMLKYKELFDIPYAHLKLEKDLSDSVEQHGLVNTRYHLYPVLTKALTGVSKKL